MNSDDSSAVSGSPAAIIDPNSTGSSNSDKELRKMVAFIMQEAGEKCREIQVKADEEFNIEKAKLVQQETLAVEQLFERKIKQAEVRRRIAESSQVNKARLRVLQAQDQAIDGILGEAKDVLAKIPGGSSYEDLLSNLMLEALFRFMDGSNAEQLTVSIQVREQDAQLAQKALSKAIISFKDTTGYTLKSAKIDETNWLPAEVLGGIVALAMGGRLRLDNTLAARLDLAMEAMLPVMRAELFGPSEQRKFFS